MRANDGVVVVLTGQFGAGCTIVAEYLEKEKSFKRYQFSEIIKKAARERLGPANYDRLQPVKRRRVLQDQGNMLRDGDPAAIAKQIIEQVEAKGDAAADVVVEAVRNPAEVHAFREAFSDRVFLVALDAPLQARFERRHSEYGDDLEQFKIDDARDKGEDEPEYGQGTEECVYLADVSINNHEQLVASRDWDRFFTKVLEYLSLMRKAASRQPTYEELYMRQAYAVSLKSSCTKRQVGAILVSGVPAEESRGQPIPFQEIDGRESYVISTGFNDVPIGDLFVEIRGLAMTGAFAQRTARRSRSFAP